MNDSPFDIHPQLLALVRRHCLDPLGYRALIAEEAFNLGRGVGRAEAAREAQKAEFSKCPQPKEHEAGERG